MNRTCIFLLVCLLAVSCAAEPGPSLTSVSQSDPTAPPASTPSATAVPALTPAPAPTPELATTETALAAESLLSTAEQALTAVYDFAPQELTQQQAEALQMVLDLFSP